MSTASDWRLPQNFDIMKAEDIPCKKCNEAIYDTVVTLKQVPARVSPTGKDAVVPIPIFKCVACGELYRDYNK